MTSRERVLTAMKRQTPDRVPFGFHGFTPKAYETFKKSSGHTSPDEYFQTDGRGVGFANPKVLPEYKKYHENLPLNAYLDVFGQAHIPGSVEHFTKHIAPLKNAKHINELIEYPLPDFIQPECWQHLKSQTERWHQQDQAVLAGASCTLFEWSWQIRGMEEFLMDLYIQPEWAEVIIDKWLNLRIFMSEKYAEAGVDVLQLGDDVGTQKGMMMNPEMWRKFFKTRMAKVIESARRIKKDILVWYHSDGNVMEIIPDLIEIGLDILNPVQPECMNPAELKKLYGNKLSFWGTIGTQSTFPFGTPDEMRRVVKERIGTVGKGGGLYLAPTHTLEPEVPWENMVAFVEAVKEYGTVPFQENRFQR